MIRSLGNCCRQEVFNHKKEMKRKGAKAPGRKGFCGLASTDLQPAIPVLASISIHPAITNHSSITFKLTAAKTFASLRLGGFACDFLVLLILRH